MLGAAAVTTGCKDDDDGDDDVVDSGNPGGGPGGGDSGSPGGGGMDSGAPNDAGGGGDAAKDAAADTGVMCGTLTCTGHTTPVASFAPGCATNHLDATVCGISTASLLDGGEPKFLEKNAQGVAAPQCAMLIDNNEPTPDGGVVDGGTKGNGRIDTVLQLGNLSIALSYPGCCTAEGFCSANTDLGMAALPGQPYMDSVGGFGCMKSSVFFRSYPASTQTIACNPQTGALIPPDGGAGGGDGGAGDGGTGGDAATGDAGAGDAGDGG